MNKTQEDNSKVCILEVDFEYPEELLIYSLIISQLLKKIEIKEKMLPDYCKKKKKTL